MENKQNKTNKNEEEKGKERKKEKTDVIRDTQTWLIPFGFPDPERNSLLPLARDSAFFKIAQERNKVACGGRFNQSRARVALGLTSGQVSLSWPS